MAKEEPIKQRVEMMDSIIFAYENLLSVLESKRPTDRMDDARQQVEIQELKYKLFFKKQALKIWKERLKEN